MSEKRSIVHICNNYVSSKVHSRLIASVDSLFKSVSQVVYVPIRRESDAGVNSFGSVRVSVAYDYCLPFFIKFFPLLKVLWVSFRFYSKVYRFHSGVIVAHSLWSDGFPAFICSRLRGGAYNIFVRGTDLNFFLPKLPHYRFLFWLVVRYADNVIFVSPAYEMEFKARYPCIFKAVRRSVILPNGVDMCWLNNVFREKVVRKDLLFVGRFDRNKNLDVVLEVFSKFSILNPDSRLLLVGGNAKELKHLLGIQVIPPGVNVLGVISDFDTLKKLYRSSAALLVPSRSETFGLVYIEALTQGCPIVHTKGQGVSGYFDGCEYVFSGCSNDVDELLRGVCFLTEHYPMGVPINDVEERLKFFSWNSIAHKFILSIFRVRP
ncbi:glycosyltransferase family 4 protein [Ectopseudomonas hydrolytica]|uniref:glycosyltransferase family 4 protein n=1 Tax=Ectopseudomonas hydrolytica TaxID=2493633 RepID=UPI003C2CDA4F